MRIENTRNRYGLVAAAFHWLMALIVIGLVGLGLYMVRLPEVGFDKDKIQLYLFHKEVGMLALGLVALRLAWRWINPMPELVEKLPDWQKIAARFVHLSFYALLVALPITGWLMTSAAALPVSFFGLFTFPDLIAPSEHRFHLLVEVHKWLGYAMAALIAVHIGAALKHHFVDRDDTLRKMLPSPSSPERMPQADEGR